MASLYNAGLQTIEPGVSTHSFNHAAKLFVADDFRLAPKQSFSYYVCINIDQSAITGTSILQSLIAPDGVSSQTLIEQYEAGMMAKRVDLPRFTIGTKTMNAYNRKNIIQTNISYDPVTITFHDDMADVITQFWNDYYTYYYRDSDYGDTLYQLPHKYQPRNREGWGYSIRNNGLKPFLRNIQIFSLHKKRFTEYLLVNPYITSWRHGEHDYSQGAGIMENAMTISYETVKYRTGYVNPVDVNGFSILHYDNTPSPIATSTSGIIEDTGLLGVIANGSRDLARPDGTGSGRGVLGTVLNAYNLYNTAKSLNLSSIAKQTVSQIAAQVVGGAINGAINNVFFPTSGGNGGYGGVYGSTQVYAQTGLIASNPYALPANTGGATLLGTAAGIASGVIVQTTTQAIDQWTRGLYTNQTGPISNNPSIYQVSSTNGTVYVNAQGQPVTGQTTALVQSADGSMIIGEIRSVSTASGTYNPQAPNENLKYATKSVQDDGRAVTEYVYKDGTTVLLDDNTDEQLQVTPGSNYGKTVAAGAPVNASTQAANGQPLNPGQPQYYTDPRTGIVYTVGGGVQGQITNTISGGVGLIAGGYVGSGVNQALQSTALGRTVIGQTVAGGLSSYIGMETAKAVNNGLQPIIGGITKSISQGWDSVTGSIKNAVGSWTGTGGYDSSNPTKNVLDTNYDPATGITTTYYKNGDRTYENADGGIEVQRATTDSGSNWFKWGSTPTGINTNSTSGILNGGLDQNLGPGTVWRDQWGNPVQTQYGDVWNTGYSAAATQPGVYGYNGNEPVGTLGIPVYYENNGLASYGLPGPDQAPIQTYDPQGTFDAAPESLASTDPWSPIAGE